MRPLASARELCSPGSRQEALAKARDGWGILEDHTDAYSKWLLPTVRGFHTQGPLGSVGPGPYCSWVLIQGFSFSVFEMSADREL